MFLLQILSCAQAILAVSIALDHPGHINATSLTLPILDHNLTAPLPPRGFRIGYTPGTTSVDGDSFFATTIMILAELAYQDFLGQMVGASYNSPPGYQRLDFSLYVNRRSSSSGQMTRKFAVWGLGEIARIYAASDTFNGGAFDLIWEDQKQGVIYIRAQIADEVVGHRNTSAVFNSTYAAAKTLRDDEITMSAQAYGEPLQYNSTILALVSALVCTAPHSSEAVTHGISVRYAPSPAYFAISDHGWDSQLEPPTQAPFLHWGILIEAVKKIFEEYQMYGDYREMEILIWAGQKELAQGGVFLVPSPQPSRITQA